MTMFEATVNNDHNDTGTAYNIGTVEVEEGSIILQATRQVFDKKSKGNCHG